MKGVALPIEVLVIVVVAVIVLLGIVAVYFSGWAPFGGTVGVDAVKNAGCRILIMNNTCGITGATGQIVFDGSGGLPVFDVGGNGAPGDDNLKGLCAYYYNASESQCKRLCGCPGY